MRVRLSSEVRLSQETFYQAVLNQAWKSLMFQETKSLEFRTFTVQNQKNKPRLRPATPLKLSSKKSKEKLVLFP